jgi:hypothetical protein
MDERVQVLLGVLAGLVVFTLVCMALVLVSTLVVQPLPTDQTGQAFFSLASIAGSPFVAGWLGWLAARSLRARLAVGRPARRGGIL